MATDEISTKEKELGDSLYTQKGLLKGEWQELSADQIVEKLVTIARTHNELGDLKDRDESDDHLKFFYNVIGKVEKGDRSACVELCLYAAMQESDAELRLIKDYADISGGKIPPGTVFNPQAWFGMAIKLELSE